MKRVLEDNAKNVSEKLSFEKLRVTSPLKTESFLFVSLGTQSPGSSPSLKGYVSSPHTDHNVVGNSFLEPLQYIGADMQKVEILPPADFQVKISAKGQNQTVLLGFIIFRRFS